MSAPARERRAVAAPTVLFLVVGGCWTLTVARMRGMDMGPGTDLGSLGWFVVVWTTMMAAMMLPSVALMAVASARAAVFVVGYLLTWVAFGVLAHEGVRSLDLGLLAWDHVGRYLAGGVILSAALYELSAAKGRCLRYCRDAELLRRRPGAVGALLMGIEQGGYCVGCSGALMAALFALGVMSIAWMLVIAALVTIEKLLPWRVIATGATAAVLAVLGAAVMTVPAHVPWLTIPMSV